MVINGLVELITSIDYGGDSVYSEFSSIFSPPFKNMVS